MNEAPDYSAAYVELATDRPGLTGYGMTFTIGRGTEIVVAAVEALTPLVVGRHLADIAAAPGRFWREVTGDSHLRWLGPDKGVVHLATAALVNAVWDLWARAAGKPVWKLVVDMSPEELVACADFRYLTDVLTPEDAVAMLTERSEGKAEREAEMRRDGYPAYSTSVGWLGFTDEEVRRRCREAVAEGWSHVKMKVGGDLEADVRRAALIREEIGPGRRLMMDANQVWEVDEAVAAWSGSRNTTRGGSRSRRARTTSSATPGSRGRWRPSASRRASTPRTASSSSSSCRRRRSPSASSTPAGSGGSTRFSPCSCSPRASACPSAHTPAASGSASTCSTSPSSTTSR